MNDLAIWQRVLRWTVRWFRNLATMHIAVTRLDAKVDKLMQLTELVAREVDRQRVRQEEFDKRVHAEVEARVRAVLPGEVEREISRRTNRLTGPPGGS